MGVIMCSFEYAFFAIFHISLGMDDNFLHVQITVAKLITSVINICSFPLHIHHTTEQAGAAVTLYAHTGRWSIRILIGTTATLTAVFSWVSSVPPDPDSTSGDSLEILSNLSFILPRNPI
jgi:hypothetical protein